MGHLAAFDIPELWRKYGLTHFVETGTGRGDSLLHALSAASFESFVSIEVDEQTANYARARLGAQTTRVALLVGESVRILPTLAMTNGPTLWWLDAHFPGSFRGVPIDTKAPRDATMPLEAELRVICAQRDVSRDVFLLDDLRIYERGAFAHGNMGDDASWPVTGCAFIDELLGTTHTISRDYREEGYLICTPKEYK